MALENKLESLTVHYQAVMACKEEDRLARIDYLLAIIRDANAALESLSLK